MKDERDLSELIEIIPDAALVVNQQGTIVLVNRLAADMYGYEHSELLGASLNLLLPEAIRTQHDAHLASFFGRAENCPMGRGLRFQGQRKSGELFHVDIMLSHVHIKKVPYAIAFIRDLTPLREAEDKIRRELAVERQQALTDYLTGVGNRRAFVNELETSIDELKQRGHSFAVALIDLDNFKQLNDSFGHEVGDKALQQIAHCIQEQCRGSDFLARIGGDEFALILPLITPDAVQAVIARINSGVATLRNQQQWQVSLSIGVCFCDAMTMDLTVETIMRYADAAMYQGKRDGKGQINVASLTSVDSA